MEIKYEFSVGTRYIGSTVRDEFVLDVDDDTTEEEIELMVQEAWCDWRNEQCDGGWKKID